MRTIRVPAWLAVCCLILASVAGGFTGSLIPKTPESVFTVAADTTTQLVFDNGFAPIVRSAAPAVVNISSSRIVAAPETHQPFGDEHFLKRFFGEDFLRQHRLPRRREHSLGSGVIISSDGFVLTNSHVIENATEIRLVLADDREFYAQVIGTDPPTDVAVLRIEAGNLSALTFANSSEVQVGDLALAIGNPFGIGRTVTMGIVSAIGRGGLGIEDYEDFIQTDAAINPGSSGGALINVSGELIGINTAILTPSGGNLGIGFAIPSNMARPVMEQILKSGRVVRGWLGVHIHDAEGGGVEVNEVAPGGPAARSDLQPGDVIGELNGRPVEDARDLRLKISALQPGTEINLRLRRDGQPRNIKIRLAELPPANGTPVPQRN